MPLICYEDYDFFVVEKISRKTADKADRSF